MRALAPTAFLRLQRCSAALSIAISLAGGLPTLRAGEIYVSAAASLTDVLNELSLPYEKASGDKLIFNYGASSLLARQIQEGAPADVFFSADEPKMDSLQSAGLIADNSRRSLLGNSLVVVVPVDGGMPIAAPADLAGEKFKRIAVAEPSSVPAGLYTREFLTKLGLWEKILPKVVPTENVRAALAAVGSGNADAGWVYKTDAPISKQVRVALEIPAADGPRITYPLAVIKSSKNPEAAKKFADYLAGAEAKKVFAKNGFTVLK